MLQHHPDIHLLTEYAAGSLSTAHSICMAVHLQHCPQCQAQLRHHSDLGAVLLESEQPSQISDNLLDSVLAKLDDGSVTQEIDSKAETAWLENSAGEFQLPAVVQKVIRWITLSCEWNPAKPRPMYPACKSFPFRTARQKTLSPA